MSPAAVAMFTRSTYVMRYIRQSSARTIVVARGRLDMSPVDERSQELGRVDGRDAREMRHLLAARHAGGGQDGAGRQAARGGQQPTFADLPRDVVVLAGVAERAGHAAAA